jgi:hypothetical protein
VAARRTYHEEDIEVRDRLSRMATHYVNIAGSEEWLARRPNLDQVCHWAFEQIGVSQIRVKRQTKGVNSGWNF